MRSSPHDQTPARSKWAVVAGAMLLVGAAASVFGAQASATHRSDTARSAFSADAAEVAARLRLTLEREHDLVVNASAQLTNDPAAIKSTFARWATSVDALPRHPEVQAMAATVPVPASQLAAYAASRPAGFTVLPPGSRPLYCFALAAVIGPTMTPGPDGLDFCAGDLLEDLTSARDTGQWSYAPVAFPGFTLLGVAVPFYRGGGVPPTVEARRAAHLGWLGVVVDPIAVLASAGAGHTELAMTLSYVGGTSDVSFTTGQATKHGQVSTTDLGQGWSVRTVGEPLPGGILSGGSPTQVLLAGLVISILLSALLLLFATGRARALRMVDQKTNQLRHQALHDALTGLPNRALVLDRVNQALARSHRNGTPLAVMFLDLDGFKTVNDTYGHAVGDQLLRAVSVRLTGALRETDTVGRLGGDEFVVVAEGDSLSMGPEPIAERIQALLSEPFTLEGSEQLVLRTHASIGIAVGLRPTADDLLRDADVALYEAKAAGKDCYVVFAPAMQMAVQDRLVLEMDLRDAVGTDQLFLAYQPTFDLRSEVITGVEALLRWNHPTRGLVMPDAFIPLAEETGLILPMGRRVLMEACRQAATWQERGHTLAVAVNVSGRQLDHSYDLVEDVRLALADSGLSPELLTLEITESMLMRDASRSAQQLRALKALGVKLAIDDFGTGYCSLAYLQQFPVDALKIDRSFISGITNSPGSDALIRTLVQLGKALGIETYAEGIEEHNQLRQLQREECDSGQGYLFAHPLSPAALEDLLVNRAGATSHIPRPTRSGTIPAR